MTLLPIPIPTGYKILVSVDQKISTGDLIASKEDSSQDLTVEVSKDLELDPKSTLKSLVKKPGDLVSPGDVLAKKGGVFGSRELNSKVGGTIVKYDQETGVLTIRTTDVESKEKNKEGIASPVDGVVEVCDNEKVVIKTDKEAILADNASGDTSFGEVIFFEQEEVDPSELDSKVSGKILVGNTFSREAVAKAIGINSIGVVGENISDSILENLTAKNIKTPVLRVSHENFKKIGKKSGKLMLDSAKKIIIRL